MREEIDFVCQRQSNEDYPSIKDNLSTSFCKRWQQVIRLSRKIKEINLQAICVALLVDEIEGGFGVRDSLGIEGECNKKNSKTSVDLVIKDFCENFCRHIPSNE